MIVALFGYVGTMLAAFVALVVAWKAVTGPPQMEKVHQQLPLIGAVAQSTTPNQATAPAKQPGEWGVPVVHKADGSDTASADAPQAAAERDAAEKAKRLQQARHQKRKTQIARQPQEQQYSTALGYDQERAYDQQRGRDFSSGGSLFNPFGPRRF